MTMRRAWLAIVFAVVLTVPSGVVLAQGEAEANLEVDDLYAYPEEPAPGDEVVLNATIENTGEADAGAFNVTFAVDGDPLPEAAAVEGLAADDEITVTSGTWTATEGEHEVTVTIDADDDVAESDEEDNTATEDVEVEPTESSDDASDEAPDDTSASSEDDDRRDDRDGPWAGTSSFERDNGTMTGEHVAFTPNRTLPGLYDYTILAEDAVLFTELQLPGDNATEADARGGFFAMETADGELMLRDSEDYVLGIEAEDDARASLTVASGVNVTESDRYSDDDEDDAVYELSLGNTTLYLYGEEMSFENGTFTLDEARLSAEFPPGPGERDDRDEDARERFREAGSQWDRTNDTFEGRHVAFTLDEALPGLLGYTLSADDTVVFDEIELANGSETEWQAHGVSFRLDTDDGRVRVLDTPTAILVVEAEDDAPATMTLADGIEIERIERDADDEDDEADEEDDDEDGRAVYRLTFADNRTAWLAGEGITLDNRTFSVEDRAHLRAIPGDGHEASNRGPGSLPDAARDRDADDEDDEDDERGPPGGLPARAKAHALGQDARVEIERAIASGNVGVEVHVSENDTEPVAVELGHVSVRNAFADPRGEVKAGMTIEAPDGSPGTTVSMNLNASDLGDLTVSEAAQELTVRFDNETIEPADDLADVLDWRDDDGDAEFLLLVGGDQVQVLVSVPHFSPHTIEVTEASTQSAEETGNATPGVGLAALVGSAALAAAVLTRKEE